MADSPTSSSLGPKFNQPNKMRPSNVSALRNRILAFDRSFQTTPLSPILFRPKPSSANSTRTATPYMHSNIYTHPLNTPCILLP